jgi:hypothetical protein
MSLPKSLRFEIFKRDSFTCQYCGRKPPEVVLNVDHVLPKAKGGGDEAVNLVTACFDCNSGKSDRLVDQSVLPMVNDSAAMRREKLDQMRALNEVMAEEREQIEEWVSELTEEWATRGGEVEGDTYFYIPREEQSIRNFVKRMPVAEIREAIDIAFARFPNGNPSTRFRFFCGVCWRKIKQKEASNVCETLQQNP